MKLYVSVLFRDWCQFYLFVFECYEEYTQAPSARLYIVQMRDTGHFKVFTS